MFSNATYTPLPILRRFAIATAIAATTIVSTSATSHAAACLDDVTHWGRIMDTKWDAKDMARAGMSWKIRNRLGDTVRIHRGTRINRCKIRYNGGWQCQASIVVNRCL